MSKFLVIFRIVICQSSEEDLLQSLPHILHQIRRFSKDTLLPFGIILQRSDEEDDEAVRFMSQ